MKTFESVSKLRLSKLTSGQFVETKGYASTSDDGRSRYLIKTPAEFNGTPDEFLDVTLANDNIASNIEVNLRASMAGILSDGGDYTSNLQALADKLDPTKTLYIDSTDYSLSDFIRFNSGFKRVEHCSASVLTWLGNGSDSTTTGAIFSVNLDSSNLKTNETVIGTTTVETTNHSNTYTLDNVVGLEVGNVIRLDQHICKVTDITGVVIRTDRTLPIPSLAIGATLAVLDIPNEGSYFGGPSLIKFAPNVTTQNYGFGTIVANCFNIHVDNWNSIFNSSKVAELFYCANSKITNVSQLTPSDINAGQGYAARISNGNDNYAQFIESHEGRHCFDITFSHRNLVEDCADYFGDQASYLTHFNGCVGNLFRRCHLYNCSFGVWLGADGGDSDNHIEDSDFMESRGAYRPVAGHQFRRCRFISTISQSTRDVMVPRGNGESVFDAIDCYVSTVNNFVNVDDDYIVNFTGGHLAEIPNFELFRGIDSGTPGAPTTTANVTFNFVKAKITGVTGLGRNNINANINFDFCDITYQAQLFGEDTGDQRYSNCTIEDVTGGVYLLTVGSGNSCVLAGNTLINVTLPWRFFIGFPATGTVSFGDNQLIEGSVYSNLNDMNWTTFGYASIILARSNEGSPIDGAIVYIDSDVTTDPFKRKRVSSSWVSWIV